MFSLQFENIKEIKQQSAGLLCNRKKKIKEQSVGLLYICQKLNTKAVCWAVLQ